MIENLVTALGLVLVIEGLFYAALLNPMRAMIRAALEMSDTQLRVGGVATIAAGVFVVWLAKL